MTGMFTSLPTVSCGALSRAKRPPQRTPQEGGEGDLLWEQAVGVSPEVMERFVDKAYPTRALAIALRREDGPGKYAIRRKDGRTFAVPRLP